MTKELLRELGALAKRRREEIGINRTALTKEAGLETEQIVRDFEHGRHVPEEDARRKVEKALNWRMEVIDEVMGSNRAAGTLAMEELDAEDSLYVAAASGSANLPAATDEEILAEVARRGL